MSIITEWFETAKDVISGPGKFFEKEQRRDGFGYPLKFAAVSVIISGVVSAVFTLISGLALSAVMAQTGFSTGLGATSTLLRAAASLFLAPIVGLILLGITAGITHIFVYLLGGKEGFDKTLAVFEYSSSLSAVSSFITWVPLLGGLVGLFFGIYGIYMNIRGVEKFQNISMLRAAAAVLIPVFLALILVIVLIAAVLAGFTNMPLAETAGTPPVGNFFSN